MALFFIHSQEERQGPSTGTTRAAWTLGSCRFKGKSYLFTHDHTSLDSVFIIIFHQSAHLHNLYNDGEYSVMLSYGYIGPEYDKMAHVLFCFVLKKMSHVNM